MFCFLRFEYVYDSVAGGVSGVISDTRIPPLSAARELRCERSFDFDILLQLAQQGNLCTCNILKVTMLLD